MPSHFNHLTFKVLILALTLKVITCVVTWTDRPDLRMGQKSIYDAVSIPINQFTNVDLTYKTPFLTAAPFVRSAVVISGFQNYLHVQININVTLTNTYQDKVILSIWVGASTYLKQLRVNFIVIQTGGTAAASIEFSIGNYRTLDLDDINGLRSQEFKNQTSTFPNVISLCSAIHGIEYNNTDGTVNQVNVNTEFVNVGRIIKHTVVVGEKGRLYYISITTILISSNFYPNPNNYVQLGHTFETNIPSADWFIIFDAMSAGGLLTSTDNSIFFGIRGFNFTMEGSRIFLLDIASQTDSRKNLNTNNYMKYTELSFLILANRACATLTDFYWVEGFQCIPACPKLLQITANKICMNCSTVCDGCTTTIGNCNLCLVGNNRVINNSVSPVNCVCDYANGYVQVLKQDKCQLCSDLISGCVKCATPNICDDCGNTTLYEKQPTATGIKCRCKNGKYLVSGVCLSFQGCIQANKYVTGEFCQKCDTLHNFQINLTNSSSCVCMTAYFINSTTGYCVDICGDSRTPITPANVTTKTQFICDDGDNISGNGCSSTCRQQYGYRCQTDIVGGISKCALQQQVKIQYLYTQKNLIANQATIVFALLPQQHFLPQNAFKETVRHNISKPLNTNIKFDPKSSLIMITVDYSEDLQSNPYQFFVAFKGGLKIFSDELNKTVYLYGRNAKLQIAENNPQVSIITYLALGVSACALAVALISAILGEKMMGIQLILPAQAAFFSMATFPRNVLSPVSALWSLKYSNGYNSLGSYDLTTNYMLDSRVNMMQYSGQYIMNYNIMFIPLVLVVVIVGMIAVRVAWLERQEKRLQDLQRKKQEEDRDEKQTKKKTPQKEQKLNSQKTDEQQTQKQISGGGQQGLEKIEEELQDARENIKNWKNFMYMIFDRFFTIFIVTAMMKVVFCFYIQLSNLTYTAEVYDNSLNAGFFFVSYATIVTGLYAIVYDYKTDKLVVFTCNKGKYAMFYISIFLGFIIVLGAIYQSSFSVYVVAIFAIMPLVLIPYQVAYGFRVIDFQNIIALICQLPFIITIAVSLILTFQKNNMQQSTSMIFAYAIIGSIGLSTILTIGRLIKFIDCKKISLIQFTDRKKQNSNDKNKKKNKVVLLQLDVDKDWDQDSQDSVRAILQERRKQDQSDIFNIDQKNKEDYEAIAQKNEPKPLEKQKLLEEDEDDQEIDELQKIKLKLRKELKQKKVLGKIK